MSIISVKKNSVLIKWKTKDRWCDCEQRVARKTISPKEGALVKGQLVKILFSGKWSPGVIFESWPNEERSCKSSGIVSFLTLFNYGKRGSITAVDPI